MDQVALRLAGTPTWTYLGGKAESKKPLEVVVRAFDREIEIATGEGASEPTGASVRVSAGEGRRLTGQHFFARPTAHGAPCRISYRGV